MALDETRVSRRLTSRFTPRLPRTTNGVRREHRIQRSRVVLIAPRSELQERSRAACSLTSQTVCAPRFRCSFADSWSADGLGSLRQASATSCFASFIVPKERVPSTLTPVADRARPDGASRRSPSARSAGRTRRWVRRDLRGQLRDPPRSPSCSRDADESVPSLTFPDEEQGPKELLPRRRRSAPEMLGPKERVICGFTLVAHRERAGRPSSSVSTRPSGRVHRLARPSRDRSPSSPPRRSCEHERRFCRFVASDGHLAGARAPGPRSPKTRGEARDSAVSPHLAVGLPSLPPDASGRVRFDQPRGRERRSVTCEDPGPTVHAIARASARPSGSPPRRERPESLSMAAHEAIT